MSKVESETDVVVGGVYRHYKNGRRYEVLGFVVNSTTGTNNGDVMVRYRRVGGEAEFVRLAIEFIEIVKIIDRGDRSEMVRRFTKVDG